MTRIAEPAAPLPPTREPLPGLAELMALLDPPGSPAIQALAAFIDRIERNREPVR